MLTAAKILSFCSVVWDSQYSGDHHVTAFPSWEDCQGARSDIWLLELNKLKSVRYSTPGPGGCTFRRIKGLSLNTIWNYGCFKIMIRLSRRTTIKIRPFFVTCQFVSCWSGNFRFFSGVCFFTHTMLNGFGVYRSNHNCRIGPTTKSSLAFHYQSSAVYHVKSSRWLSSYLLFRQSMPMY